MRKTSGTAVVSGHGGEQKTGFKRLPAINAASLVKAILLGATLWVTTAPASFAQSYDPDVGSGNLVRPYGGARYFGGIRSGWRAMVIPHRARHGRHHPTRHR